MAKYETMDEMIIHLKQKNAHKPFSDAKVDELIIALGDEKRSSKYLRHQLNGRHWDAIYNAIINGFVATQYWKHSHRLYWLTPNGVGYYAFLTDLTEKDSETESVESSPSLEVEISTEENEQITAAEVAVDLGATILSETQRANVEHLMHYYESLLIADQINRSAGLLMASVELDHCVIQINGSGKQRKQLLELLNQINQQQESREDELSDNSTGPE